MKYLEQLRQHAEQNGKGAGVALTKPTKPSFVSSVGGGGAPLGNSDGHPRQLTASEAALERRRAFVVRELQEHAELRVSTDVQNAPMRPEPGEPVSVVIAVRVEGPDPANESGCVQAFEGGVTTRIISAEYLIPRERFDIVLFTQMLEETSRRPS